METFQSPDVLRLLGHKLPTHGGVHGKYAGQIVSDLKQRPRSADGKPLRSAANWRCCERTG